jgi:hypothetical protein
MYIDDVKHKQQSIPHIFHSIYPNELEIKDITEYSTSASYLDVLLKLDTNARQINDSTL